MAKPLFLSLSALAGLAMVAPAHAQQNDRQLIIYGNDRCPEGSICVRAPETDRYRIPQTLRQGTLAPTEQPWGARAASVSRAGASSGTGSCSTAGAGGWTGCWNKMIKDARDDRRQQNAAAGASAEPK